MGITPLSPRTTQLKYSPCGVFPDGESALMLVCARLRHVASYFSLNLMLEQTLRYFCEKPLTLPTLVFPFKGLLTICSKSISLKTEKS